MNRSEGAKKVGPPQKNSLDPLLIVAFLFMNPTVRYHLGNPRIGNFAEIVHRFRQATFLLKFVHSVLLRFSPV